MIRQQFDVDGYWRVIVYYNLNYGLLGTIIEAVSVERFDLYLQNNILKDLDIIGGYLPGNFSDTVFASLGTLYQKKDIYMNQIQKQN